MSKGNMESKVDAFIKDESTIEPLDFTTIRVTLTFEDYPQWVFKFRRQLSKRLHELKQSFYGLTKEEQDAQLSSHRIGMLGELLKERPAGLDGLGYPNTENLIEDFRVFFSQEGMDDELTNVWALYQGKLYPKELLLDTSGQFVGN